MTPISKQMGPLEWGLLVALSIVWGGSFFFAKVALGEVPPLTIVLVRVGLAAAVLVALVYASGRRMPANYRLWTAFFVMGLLNNAIPFSLIFWGQLQIASGLAAILNATTPLFTVAFAHVLTRDEKMTVWRLLGVVLGVAGVAIMFGGDALTGFGVGVWAQIAVLGAGVSYAFAGIYGRRFAATPPMVTAAGQVTASSVLLLPLVLVVDQPWQLPMPGASTWAALVALAVVSTAFVYIIYFRILAVAGATNILLVTFLIPVSAILLGTLILGEVLEPRHFVGFALIGAGLAAIDGRLVARLRGSG